MIDDSHLFLMTRARSGGARVPAAEERRRAIMHPSSFLPEWLNRRQHQTADTAKIMVQTMINSATAPEAGSA